MSLSSDTGLEITSVMRVNSSTGNSRREEAFASSSALNSFAGSCTARPLIKVCRSAIAPPCLWVKAVSPEITSRLCSPKGTTSRVICAMVVRIPCP